MDIRTERILIEFTKTWLRQTDICNLTGTSKSLMCYKIDAYDM